MDKVITGKGVRLLMIVSMVNLVFLFSELAFNVLGVMFS